MHHTSDTKTIYILFTRTTTCFSRLISWITEDAFTHSAIGLEGPSGSFYSFGRKNPPYAFPADLIEERLHPEARRYPEGTPCCLCALTVSDETYAKLRCQLREMLSFRDMYRYNLLGVMSCYFCLPVQRRYHYFCSQFVSALLVESGAIELEKPPALIRPSDLYLSGQLQVVYQGATHLLTKSTASYGQSQFLFPAHT